MSCRDPEGRLRTGDWISSCAAAIREVIVDRCYEVLFERMGLGHSLDSIAGRVRRTVDPAEVRRGYQHGVSLVSWRIVQIITVLRSEPYTQR